jgi:putative methyltransferase (TIGR04325 family)
MRRETILMNALIPPIFHSILKKKKKRYAGDYPSWNQALLDSTGYDSDIIVTKVKDALLKVKRGEAVYERDSVLFDQIQYSFPVLCGLLRAALEGDGELNVLDFGGSLGSSYYQNKGFLAVCKDFRWNIIEQEKFVRIGREFFQDDQLKFYFSLKECMDSEFPNVVLLSGVLQFIEKPYDLLREIISYRIKYVIIDRTPVAGGEKDYLTIQNVPPEIYSASYPEWIFSEKKLLDMFKDEYFPVLSVDSSDSGLIELNETDARSRCYVLRLDG